MFQAVVSVYLELVQNEHTTSGQFSAWRETWVIAHALYRACTLSRMRSIVHANSNLGASKKVHQKKIFFSGDESVKDY
jgi:hypothetical protein